MTFEDWQATREAAQMGLEPWIVDDNFGYVPDGVKKVWCYDCGVIVELKDGQFFTHCGRSEHAGTLEEVERRLWDEHVTHEVTA